MVTQWLTFGLTPDQEHRYRNSCLKADLAQAKVCILLLLVPVVGFAYNDYAFLGLSRPFYGVSALRLVVLTGAILLVRSIRKTTDYRTYDKAEFAWGILVVCLLWVIAALRPQAFMAHAIIAVAGVFIALFAVPNRFTYQLVLAVAIAVGDVVILAPAIWTLHQAAMAVVLSVIMAGTAGIASAHQFHAQRRWEFLAREREQEARATAESELLERKQAEEAVRESRAKLQAAFASMTEAIFVADAKGRLIDFNDQFIRYHRFRDRDECSRTIADCPRYLDVWFADGTDAPLEQWAMPRALRGETASNVEYRLRRKETGETWWGSYSFAPIKDQNGRITGAVVAASEVTARKAAEEALRESEEQFRILTQNLQSAVALIDERGAFSIVNSSFLRMFDIPQDADILNVNSRDWAQWQVFDEHGALLDVNEHPVRKAALTRTAVKNQLVALKAPSSLGLKWLLVSAEPISDAQGRLHRLICTYYDITAHKAAEEALRRSEARWNAAIESFAEGAIIATEDEQVVYWNPAARKMHGFTRPDEGVEPLKRTPVTFQLWTPDGSHMLELDEWPMRRIKRGETVRNLELRIRRPDQGWEKVFSYSGALVDTAGGERLTFLTCHDLTELRRAEQALRDSDQRFRLALRNAPVSVAVQDRDLRYIWAYNQRSARPDQIIGRTDYDIFAPAEAEHITALKRRVLDEGIELREQMWLDRPSGRMFLDICWEPVRNNAGNVVGVASATLDLTPIKMAETAQQKLIEERGRLLESERSARGESERANRLKDEFLANLSHELRTPLNAILGWTQILRRGNADAESIGKGLEVIERNTRIQAQLISDLLDLSRIMSGKMRLEVRNCDPVAALKAAIDSLAPAAEAKRIRIEKLIEPLPGPVLGDPDRLQQAFWNLLSNAIKFTSSEGRVQIIMRRTDSRIEIVFRDTGKGISPDFLPYLFERFRQADPSTTKTHAGLGLGLAIVKNLVELHGGTVKAESPGEGQGATFTVTLPMIAIKQEGEPGAERTSAEVLGLDALTLNGLKVLFVDDEADTREMVKRLLEERGASVAVADCAAKGVALLQELRPDVLVGDIGMPGEDGYEMIRKIRKLPPAAGGQTPAIALTAYSRMEDRTRAMLAGFQYHLAKPVEAVELVATLGVISERLPKTPGNS